MNLYQVFGNTPNYFCTLFRGLH